MIRQPISRRWHLGLGLAGIGVLLVSYTVLAQARQRAARNDQRRAAESRLASVVEQQETLDAARQAAGDDAEKLAAVDAQGAELETERAKWEALRDNPDKQDLTVPSWGQLLRDGLIRVCTPQGSFRKKEVWIVSDFSVTGLRLINALLLGLILSIVAGLAMGCFDGVEAFLTPPFALFSKVPATAVLPIFFVLVQINFKMYLAIIAFGMIPTLAQAISANVRKDVPDELVYKGMTLGASQFELIWEVVLRQVLPRILDAARLQVGPALVLLVAAEWMVAGEGVGYRLRLFYQRTDMTVVFVYMLVLGLLGLLVDYSLIWLRRRLCPWFGD